MMRSWWWPGPMILAAILAGPEPAGAQNIPDASPPVCVAGCPESGSQEGSDGGRRGGIFNLLDRISERQKASAERRRAEAHTQNEAGVAAFKRGDYAEALRLFRQAEGNDSADAVIRQNVKNAEAALAAKRTEQQREEELRKEQAEYRQGARQVAALMPVVRVMAPTAASGRDRARVPPLGFPPERWRAYLEAQEVVDLLYEKLNRGAALSDAEAQAFYEALRRRNAIWAEAQARPLTDGERERLRLTLPVTVSPNLSRGAPPGANPAASPDRRAGPEPSRSDALTNAFVAEHLTDQQVKVGDRAVSEWLHEVHGERATGHFERLIALARVLVKAKDGGSPEAGAEVADLTISRLPEPLGMRAEFAKEGGRIYSNVVFRAMDRFMVDAMNAVGVTFDPVAFRKRVKEDLSHGQKGVGAWATGE